MKISQQQIKEAKMNILYFLIILTLFSTLFHLAIVCLYPSRLYVGALMWMPALAAICTIKVRKGNWSLLQLSWPKNQYNFKAYLIPLCYVCLTYSALLILGLGELSSLSALLDWFKELGLVGFNTLPIYVLIPLSIILLGTVEIVRSMATTLGEEIGWRGFFIFELRKVMSFTNTALLSGFVWAAWHWPIIVFYGSNVLLELCCFGVFIISISFIMTYYTFKSKSVWPAVIFHAVSNVYIQKVFPAFVQKVEGKEYWHGEYGLMLAIVSLCLGIYFWRKALKEQL